MKHRISLIWPLLVCCMVSPGVAMAQTTVMTGTLEAGDPTFNRPSTSFPPCDLSSNGTAVYYNVHTGDHPGGPVWLVLEGTVDRLVLASYSGGPFNPASPCDNIFGVGGCFTLPVASEVPVLVDPGAYELVVTTCYNGDGGSYTVTVIPFLFWDDFESGNTGAWSTTVP